MTWFILPQHEDLGAQHMTGERRRTRIENHNTRREFTMPEYHLSAKRKGKKNNQAFSSDDLAIYIYPF